MTTYLFVTDGEHYDAAGVENTTYNWSCSKTAEPGDRALVYLKGEGIAYEWQIETEAEPDETWRYVCEVSFVRSFDPPISFGEIRSAVPSQKWRAPNTHFRGVRSIRVPEGVDDTLRGLREGASPR